MRRAYFVVAAGAVALGGCTTLGTNVSGSFQCEAPDGVCAPSTVIDDQAIAEIEQVTSTELLNPAGPYRIDDGEAPVAGQTLVASQTAAPADTYSLQVVFPAFVDARGVSHERTSVSTTVRLPGRGDAVDALALRGESSSGGRGLLAAAEAAPPYLAIASSPVELPSFVSSSQQASVSGEATPGPVERIKEEVQTALAQGSVRKQAASFPAGTE
jgi:conjugal transfer pilus assembly protein TraV